jgi:phenylalanyl-tRNA synthetase beta chain
MKILYSKIQELVPSLTASPQALGEMFTMTGLMMDAFDEVKYKGKTDYLLGLEVRQNRPDCLSAIGLAYEVSAYYGLDLQLPVVQALPEATTDLHIKISADKYVKRVVAVQLAGLKNQESPDWLKSYLELYEINSINLLVDLSNYVMLLTGYTSHLLDVSKLNGRLTWDVNKDKQKIKTLDGTEYNLSGEELVIKDDKNILALAGIVGCQAAAIDENSKDVIIEMAVYNRFIVQQNSRSLSITTEASNRLSKDMDANGIDYAFTLLVNLLMEHAGGTVTSSIFNYYPKPKTVKTIEFDPLLPSKFSGIEISGQRVRELLENLRFTVEDSGDKYKVTVPTDRMDIDCPEDLVEEVVRLNRYDKIPIDQLPRLEVTPDITPIMYRFKEIARDNLSARGFDEILSQPLVSTRTNQNVNWLNWKEITTQNSVNEEYPDLRQAIAAGLLDQAQSYLQKNIVYLRMFELGKIFGRSGARYEEKDALGILSMAHSVNEFRKQVERLLRAFGIVELDYVEAELKPRMANPHACWNIKVKGELVGILCKLKPLTKQSLYYAELDLTTLLTLLDHKINAAVELIKKLVILDTNVEIEAEKMHTYLDDMRKKLGEENVWSIEIVDAYQAKDDRKTKYTVRVSYQELSDKDAKALHTKVFG